MANILRALRLNESWKSAAELHNLEQNKSFPRLHIPSLREVLAQDLKRGSIVEIHGDRSSGRTALSLNILAQVTRQEEVCAVLDLQNSFAPASAQSAGVDLSRLVWVRCNGNVEHAIRSCDLLLHAGGLGLILLDLCDAPARALNKIPLSYWHRFRRSVEHTPTILLLCTDLAQAKSCSNQSLQTKRKAFAWSGNSSSLLLKGLETHVSSPKILPLRPQALFLKSVA